MGSKIFFISAALLVLFLMLVYPPSNLLSQNHRADTPDLSTKHSILETFVNLPTLFIENQGQLDPAVRYYIKAPRQTLYFTRESIVLDLISHDQPEADAAGAEQADRLILSITFQGAICQPVLEGRFRGDGVVNYFIGNDPAKWRTDIPTYRELLYRDIYPGIDLRLYGSGGVLRYDFIVNPGASPDDISLAYSGIEGIEVKHGELVISTALGELRQSQPYIYQQINGKRVEVAGGFRLDADNTYGFYVADYNRSHPLIVDPALAYSTYLGGTDADYGGNIAVDASGCAYVTGETESVNFPIQNPFQAANAGRKDVFVTKLSASGNALVYSTYFGGTGDDYEQGIAVDALGCAYVSGYTESTDFPTQNPFQAANAGNADVFLARLSATGSALIYSTYLGDTASDFGYGIAVDTSGCAYVTGVTYSVDFPTKNQYQGYPGDDWYANAFVAKIDTTSSGNDSLVYSTYLGGEKSDYAYGIAVDASGCAYVGGYTRSIHFPTQNPFQAANAGNADVFLARLSASGNALVYSTYLGGTGDDCAYGIAVDASGCAYVTGFTDSTTDFPTQNPFQAANAGSRDVFLARLSATGSALIYSTYLGGTASDYGYSIAVDTSGCAYITGVTYSVDFPTLNAFQTDQGGIDPFVTKLDTTKSGVDSLVYSTYLGGSSADRGYGIAVDASNCAYVTGNTGSSDFPTQNPFQAANAGNGDAFLAKLCTIAPTVTTQSATGVGTSSATLNMSFTLGEYDTVEVRFAYKKTADANWSYTNWVAKSQAGSHQETVSGLVSGTRYDFKAQLKYDSAVVEGSVLQFTTQPVPPPAPERPRPVAPGPAQLSIQNLRVAPSQTYPNSPVEVSLNVVNGGGTSGTYTVRLLINGYEEGRKSVTAGPFSATPVKFSVYRAKPGTYNVAVDGQQATFTVVGAASGSSLDAGGLIALIVIGVVLLAGIVFVFLRLVG
jgi:hypothetical protein